MKNLDFKKLENLGKKYLKYSLVGFICAVLADQLEIIDFISSGFIDLFIFLFLGIIAYEVGKIIFRLLGVFPKKNKKQEKLFIPVSFVGIYIILLFCWVFFVLPWEIENIKELIEDFKVSAFLEIFYPPIFFILPFIFLSLFPFGENKEE